MSPGMGPAQLTKQDTVDAAAELEVEPAALAAVADVESSGSGFLPDGRPKILFEGHIFWQELQRRGINPEPLQEAHPTIVYSRWTREHYLGGAREYDRLAVARQIHEEAALCSTSWGMFQLMGFNFGGAGFSTVGEFVEAQERSEKDQLLAACRWMKHAGLLDLIRRKDWEGFARRYNGPEFKKNRYDERLAATYAGRAAEDWAKEEEQTVPVTVVVDGHALAEKGILREGSSWAPLRLLAETVGWVILETGDDSAAVHTPAGDVRVDMTILGGRGFARVTDLCRKLGWDPPVWDDATQTVRVSSK